MPFMPFNVLGMWLRGLLSIVILAGGIYLLYRWYDDSRVVEPTTVSGEKAEKRVDDGPPGEDHRPASNSGVVAGRRVFRFEPGWNRPTLELAAALALLAWACLGRWIGQSLYMLMLRSGTSPSSPPDPAQTSTAGAKPEHKNS